MNASLPLVADENEIDSAVSGSPEFSVKLPIVFPSNCTMTVLVSPGRTAQIERQQVTAGAEGGVGRDPAALTGRAVHVHIEAVARIEIEIAVADKIDAALGYRPVG